jgi:[protein-PII] uridylyltransferase
MSNNIPITLVALGSYGREELCIYSDIDLMFVYKDLQGYNLKQIIEAMLYTFWDAGLKLGHRVHEVSEIFSASNTDITIKTAMIESRYLCGSKFLWMEVSTELSRVREYKQKEFVKETLKNLQLRHEKYKLTMEPNIKECSGGLRDANTLFWIANVTQKIASLRDLTPGILNDEEYKELRSSIEFLYRVRSALHLIANKKQDTLSLQFVPDVSQRLGFKDIKSASSQFKLSAKTFQALWRVNISSKIFTNKLSRIFYYNPAHIPLLKKSRIAPNIYLCEGKFYASYHIKPKKIEEIIDEIAPYLDTPVQFHISFIQYLKKAILPKRMTKKIYQSFRSLLAKNHCYSFLYTMYKANLLQVMVPSFTKILYLPQFDGYHEHTVDIHSLLTLKMIENIEDEYVKALFDTLSIEERSALKLATFMHDFGKGRVQDHCIVGEKLFRTYATKLEYKSALVDTCANVIRHHTLMSYVSRTQDLYNDKTIYSFISYIKSKKALDFLYIMTYCDISAVSHSLYTPYVAKMLKDLYNNSVDGISRDEIIGETKKRLNKEKLLEKNEQFQRLSSIEKKKILSVQSNLFFVRHKTEEILNICALANNIKEFTYKIENKTHLVISIIKKQQMNLGYFLLKLSHLDLVHMDVFKLFNEKKYFKIEYNERVDEHQVEQIKQIINDSFDMSLKYQGKKPNLSKRDIKIDCDYSKSFAKMMLHAKDQKGLMGYIVALFDEFGIDIATAKIQTIKNSTRNLFLIEKNGNFCNNVEKILKLLVKDR